MLALPDRLRFLQYLKSVPRKRSATDYRGPNSIILIRFFSEIMYRFDMINKTFVIHTIETTEIRIKIYKTLQTHD